MQLRQLSGCKNGPCPKVFKDIDSQDVIVQGYAVQDPLDLARVGNVPSGEAVVRIPRAIFAQAIRAMRKGYQ